MLKHLTVKNFALIRNLSLELKDGLTVITGETGAGKSILLGALELLLGKRADTSVLLENEKKCVVEGYFLIDDPRLQKVFENYDLDYDRETIIRREISPNGKSRAFINDTPVTLKILKHTGSFLIDIHSQHQTIAIHQTDYQLGLLDQYAQLSLKTYRQLFETYHQLTREVKEAKERQETLQKEYDFNLFQYREFEKVVLDKGHIEETESQLTVLKNAENIKSSLFELSRLLSGGEPDILSGMQNARRLLQQISAFSPVYEEMLQRFESIYLEIEDLGNEIEQANETLEIDPGEQERLQEELDEVYRLQQKHRVQSVEELLSIKENLHKKLTDFSTIEFHIEELEKEKQSSYRTLLSEAGKISKARKEAAMKLQEEIERSLHELGMPDARFEIHLHSENMPNIYGIDSPRFLFSANKGGKLQELSKVASGGELSRLLLSIKAAIANKSKLPTLIFDEIDTGISGEIAKKTANILYRMAQSMQLLAITHLPQIAAKGKTHLRVQKRVENDITSTYVSEINPEERSIEIAKMIDGEHYTEAALKTAKELLK